MPALETYDLFLSHVWRSAQNGEYYRLVALLNGAPNFRWRDYSVPEHDPLGRQSNAQLRRALDRQIAPAQAHVVVFICGENTHSAKGVEAEMTLTCCSSVCVVRNLSNSAVRQPTE